jgi:membrane fusion protein, multidrug efflux system
MTRKTTLLPLIAIVLTAIACQPPAVDPPAPPPAHVTVVHPDRGALVKTITLPGDVAGFYQSALYAKVTGYLKSISVDKGDWVKAGQVLAIIEVPELDQQLSRAQADLEVQKLTYQRLETVWKSDPRLVARQDVDIANGKYQEAKANVDELLAMDSYRRITAPFDGVITARYVDPGALIHAGGQQGSGAAMQGSARSGGSAAPVVSIARLDKLRIYVYVPQREADSVHRGMPAKVTVEGLHGAHFAGVVARFAHSLDLATRTMLTEVDLENPEHKLYPGMYANVTLVLQNHPDALRVPVSAVGGDTARKVFLVKEGRLAEVPVTTGINNGRYVEIVAGLSSSDLVVSKFNISLESGEAVKSDLIASGHVSSLASAE